MSVHEDLLNNGENNCSFTEDEVDIMCSEDGDDALRSSVRAGKEIKSEIKKESGYAGAAIATSVALVIVIGVIQWVIIPIFSKIWPMISLRRKIMWKN